MKRTYSISILLLAFTGFLHATGDSNFHRGKTSVRQGISTSIDTIPLLLMDVGIYNETTLNPLFQKLAALKKGERKRVNVLHLGDSHVQMGYFAGAIRGTFDSLWGLGGFGTIFPYQIAKYNPFYVQTKVLSGEWEGNNYLKDEEEYKHGVLGFTVRTYASQGSFEISTRSISTATASFRRVRLLYGDPSGNYTIEIKGSAAQNETGGMETAKVCGEKKQSATSEWQWKDFCFDTPQDKLQLNVVKEPGAKGGFNVYGFVLEDDTQTGVVYNNCGVGGSQFSSLYNNASLSKEQIVALEPDLIIFSYGSNESYMKSFDSVRYQAMVNEYMTSLKKLMPGVAILLTSPPDTRFKNLYPRNTGTIQHILQNAADQTQVAYLDLREQMGGDGSMARWLPAKLAAQDKLHFTKEGYTLQANLLMRSFIEAYNNSVDEASRVDEINLGNYILSYPKQKEQQQLKVPDKMK